MYKKHSNFQFCTSFLIIHTLLIQKRESLTYRNNFKTFKVWSFFPCSYSSLVHTVCRYKKHSYFQFCSSFLISHALLIQKRESLTFWYGIVVMVAVRWILVFLSILHHLKWIEMVTLSMNNKKDGFRFHV